MPEETHVPGLGNVKKKTLYWGLGGVAVIGGILYWRHQAASSQTPQTATDTTGTGQDQSTYDPNMPGSYGGSVSDYGGWYGGNIPTLPTGITSNTQFQTNEDWASAVENDLLANGYDQGTVATAISRVLAGLSVTSNQKDIFMQGIGLIGQPPQGYPTPIKVTNPGHHPPPTEKVAVPNVVGIDVEQASQILSAAGLKANGPRGITGVVHVVTGTSPHVGTQVNKGSTVKLSFRSVKEKVPVKK